MSVRSGLILLATVAAVLFSTARAADEPPERKEGSKSSGEVPAEQSALEQAFAERMSGVVFSGHYSVTAGKEEKPAQMEKYTISKVSKIKEDVWLFTARIQYGKHDLTIPMTLQVKWAGDTPVITLTDLTIPGLGKFTSRVLIYGDRYAGTWQHDKTGGHLWGRIEKAEKEESEKPAPESKKAEK